MTGPNPSAFAPAYYSYNPSRFNGDYQPSSPQADSAFIAPTRYGLDNLPVPAVGSLLGISMLGL